MAHVTEPAVGILTAADLVERFGPVPLSRLRHDPAPGTASEHDVVEIHDREDRLYELVDGILLEKTADTYEAYLAGLLVHLIWTFVKENDLGIVLGADGMMRLAPGLVRIPDASFISWARLPGRKIPRDPIADLAPDLAVEVISKGNTREEMQRKLSDYFTAAVRQVWYVYPERREIRVYVAPQQHTVFNEQQTLGGGELLPGFSLELRVFFADAGQVDES
jgi:Uma2 family endonuclease